MNKKDKENRFLELEKQAIDNFLEVQMKHGMTSIIENHLDDDEKKEYYQLEKELY